LILLLFVSNLSRATIKIYDANIRKKVTRRTTTVYNQFLLMNDFDVLHWININTH